MPFVVNGLNVLLDPLSLPSLLYNLNRVWINTSLIHCYLVTVVHIDLLSHKNRISPLLSTTREKTLNIIPKQLIFTFNPYMICCYSNPNSKKKKTSTFFLISIFLYSKRSVMFLWTNFPFGDSNPFLLLIIAKAIKEWKLSQSKSSAFCNKNISRIEIV